MIIEDNSVCGGQIDTQATRASAKQEDEDIRSVIKSGMGQTNVDAKGQTEFASP